MEIELSNRLNRFIDRYEAGEINEEYFHSSLETTIDLITELHLDDVRIFLRNKEGSLEYIDFMVNKEDRRNEYLAVIREIKEYIRLRLNSA